MDIHELHKKIKVVLDEEKRAYAVRGRSMGGLGSLNIGLQSAPNQGWTTEGQIPSLLFDKSGDSIISSPNATLLLRLYSTLDPSDKENLKSFLITHLRRDSEYADIAYFIFFVFYRIGVLLDALKVTRKELVGDKKHGYSNLLGTLSMIISREYLQIDTKTYEAIELIRQGDTEYDFQLKERINLAKFKHLEIELRDVNPEINTDRDKVLELWGKRFADPQIPTLVSEIEDYFREGDFSETKLATCIGRIRVLLVEVTKGIALAVGSARGAKSIPGDDDKRFFEYLRSQKYLSDPEWNIMRSLYDLASTGGAHAPIANREYARLVRNMTYEGVLLLLSRSTIDSSVN
jgi:hypothetical protein